MGDPGSNGQFLILQKRGGNNLNSKSEGGRVMKGKGRDSFSGRKEKKQREGCEQGGGGALKGSRRKDHKNNAKEGHSWTGGEKPKRPALEEGDTNGAE